MLQSALDDGEEERKTLRGAELKELHAFILEKDTDGGFAGLVRICDKDSGKVIWVSEASKAEMEREEEATNEQSTANSGFVAKTRSNVEQASDSNAAKPIADWNVDEVASWLRDVMKLNDVATATVEEEIDGAVIVKLEKEDWKELGASGMKAAKLLAAVEKLL